MKIALKLFVVVFFIILLSSCSISKSETSTSSTTEFETENTITDITVENSYDIYSLGNINVEEYKTTVDYTEIDEDYISDLNSAITTEDFSDVQTKYINIWKEEIDHNTQTLLGMLSEQEQDEFLNLTLNWEEQMLNTAKADRAVLNPEIMGSAFEWEWLSSIRQQYRDRAIHIKYLIYIKGTH